MRALIERLGRSLALGGVLLVMGAAGAGPAAAATGDTVRASLDAAGQQFAGASDRPAISQTGQFVAFDAGGHVFLRDLTAGITTQVDVSSGGVPAVGGTSDSPSVSADGREIVFVSRATNLTPDPANGRSQVFLRDVRNSHLPRTVRLSERRVAGQVEAGRADSFAPQISPDGLHVVWNSASDNLVPTTGSGTFQQVYGFEVATGTLSMVSRNSLGDRGNGDSSGASVDDSGRFVAFTTGAHNLSATLVHAEDVARVDRDTNVDGILDEPGATQTTAVARNAAGQLANDSSSLASISADGRFVTFSTRATNMGAGLGGNTTGGYVRDLGIPNVTTIALTVPAGELQAGDAVGGMSLSGDGTRAALSMLRIVHTGPRPQDVDITELCFVRDTAARTTVRADATQGTDSDGSLCEGAVISRDGRFVAFGSNGTNLFVPDHNGATEDVYRHEL